VALQRADSQVAQAEADYQAAKQDLMERVAQRYFDVLGAQDDVEPGSGPDFSDAPARASRSTL